jgi:hypothetical protein
MKRIFTAAALALLLSTSAQGADNWTIGMPKYSPLASLQRPQPAPRMQPVVGSTQRTGHFNNPFTHKVKYTKMLYNPLLGTFAKQKFRG